MDAGDTRGTAAVLGLTGGEVRLAGAIGDGRYGARDVDLYQVVLAAGQTIVVDIDAQVLSGGSTLDSYVRLFNSAGRQVARNDDGVGTLDSELSFRASKAGTYYVGISGYGNAAYSPSRAGSGRNGSTGVYQVRFALSAVASWTGGRVAGGKDSRMEGGSASAFAAYGANWEAALPSESLRGTRRFARR